MSNQNQHTDDPFDGVEKTELSGGGNVIDIDGEESQQPKSDEEVRQADDVHQDVIEQEPEFVKPKPVKKLKDMKQTGGKGLSAFAIALAVGAIGISGFSIKSQMDSQDLFSESMMSVNESIGTLTQESDERKSLVRQFDKTIKDNANKIKSIDNLRNEYSSLAQDISNFKSSFKDFQQSINGSHSRDVDDINEKLKKLDSMIQSLKNKPSTKRRVAIKKLKAKPIDKTKLEGATLASLDSWGTKPYAMLRDQSGQWVALTKGDYYKGWRFSHASGDTAMFKKGSKSRDLVIEE